MQCDQCKRTLTQIKIDTGDKRAWLWTSHESNRILCADCLIDEYESLGKDIPNNSLRSLNDSRKSLSSK